MTDENALYLLELLHSYVKEYECQPGVSLVEVAEDLAHSLGCPYSMSLLDKIKESDR